MTIGKPAAQRRVSQGVDNIIVHRSSIIDQPPRFPLPDVTLSQVVAQLLQKSLATDE
jgi:hypothetical protein